MFMVGCTSGHHLGGPGVAACCPWLPPAAPSCPGIPLGLRSKAGGEGPAQQAQQKVSCGAGAGSPPTALGARAQGLGRRSSLSEAEGGLCTVLFISPLLSFKAGRGLSLGEGRPAPPHLCSAGSLCPRVAWRGSLHRTEINVEIIVVCGYL